MSQDVAKLREEMERSILKILGEEIRLVARQEYNCETCGEPTVWMVKPGTLERAVSRIVASIEAGAELAAKRVAYRAVGVDADPKGRNPDGSDYHLMAAIDERLAEKSTEIDQLKARLAVLEEYPDTYGPGLDSWTTEVGS